MTENEIKYSPEDRAANAYHSLLLEMGIIHEDWNYCPKCGRKVVWEE